MKCVLRSIRRILIVVTLLWVAVTPTSAHPSANARPPVDFAASANSRLAYQIASEAPTNQIIIKYRATADISGANGRLQDLRDAYSLIRDEYEKAWLRENRPYWLYNVLARYDLATQMWITRADRVNATRQQLSRTRRLKPAEEVGIPAAMPGLATLPPA